MRKDGKKETGYLKSLYSNINKTAFWVTLTISVSLILISFFLPPQGAVDPSVIGAVGELFAFASLATVIEGIERGRSVSLQKGETQLHINKDTDSGEGL